MVNGLHYLRPLPGDRVQAHPVERDAALTRVWEEHPHLPRQSQSSHSPVAVQSQFSNCERAVSRLAAEVQVG
eukprot:7905994-Pyramimonas_sp.AAC.1